MMCKHPFMRDPQGNVRWQKNTSYEERLLATPFPCGRCLPCKINRSRVWTHRILLESSVNEFNSFVTLTYNEDNLPEGGNLSKEHVQKFVKSLRRKFDYDNLNLGIEYYPKFRYFFVGEYGSKSMRPHYHGMLFGLSFSSVSIRQIIESIWSKGFVMLGECNKATASYISQYVIKGLTRNIDPRLSGRDVPEFMLSSRRNGGIGAPAIDILVERILSSSHSKYLVSKTIKEFSYGKASMPLGGYLTNRLKLGLGTSQDLFDKEFYDYQSSLFEGSVSPYFYDDLVSESDHDRFVQEKKFNLYSKGRSL